MSRLRHTRNTNKKCRLDPWHKISLIGHGHAGFHAWFREKNSLVMSIAFTLTSPSFEAVFFRSTDGLQTSHMYDIRYRFEAVLNSVLNKFYEQMWAISRIFPQTVSNPKVSDLSCEKSGPVSLKRLMTVLSSIILRRTFRYLKNFFRLVGEEPSCLCCILWGKDTDIFKLLNSLECLRLRELNNFLFLCHCFAVAKLMRRMSGYVYL